MDYKELLKSARLVVPENVQSSERFEIPKVRGHIQGNKTIVSNFHQIASTLQRPIAHLLKYVLKELATPGELKKTGLLFGSKISAARINEKINAYSKEFVICKECNKPDTKVVKEGNFDFLKCNACGAKQPIKSKI
jgi:translation initiation factor 2 subunit 2